MNKLTQQEAQDLITKAWKMVSDQNLGSYRFGQSLYNLIPYDPTSPSIEDTDADFFYEPDPDIVIEKFYKYFVEDSNNQLDS